MGFGYYGFDLMDSVFPILFLLVFVIVIGMFVMMAVHSAKEWHHNNQSPVLTVEADVVTKRQRLSHHADHHASTWYYVTFEVGSGDRMEFSVSGNEYGMLAEGDRGRLTFQGSRYMGFERTSAAR